MKYWLMKSEPSTFSIQDLSNMSGKRDHWDGIRNYQARNFMRDDMGKGDKAFFYHSSCDEPGIVGIMTIIKEAYVDHTAFDKNSAYYDPKSTNEKPRWQMVDVKLDEIFSKTITLNELKKHQKLHDMQLLKKGNRLSITPVSKTEWSYILKLKKD